MRIIFFEKTKNIHCMPLLVDCTNIFDIAYLIAKSNGFAGTSLHGAITSMAYSVPHVGLNPSISKLVAYFEDWAFGETRSVVPFKEMHSQFVINSSISKSSYQENSKMLSNLSLGRIDQIKIIAAS
ncbi:MAG: polysaccharide pyruvyl transferase family protein [Saprospirales bacterium]|nr:polysaccharide pyruvyl transferase family protein [Saprospirales bacterium]